MNKNNAPFTGPYYWIPLPDNSWKLVKFADEFYGGHAAHVKIWPEVVINLAQEWGLNAVALRRQLENTPYGLPRGRVVFMGNNHWGIAHGDDHPTGTSLDMVKRAFNLPRQKTTLLPDEHEHVMLEDVQLVRNALKANYPIATPPEPFADEWDDDC